MATLAIRYLTRSSYFRGIVALFAALTTLAAITITFYPDTYPAIRFAYVDLLAVAILVCSWHVKRATDRKLQSLTVLLENLSPLEDKDNRDVVQVTRGDQNVFLGEHRVPCQTLSVISEAFCSKATFARVLKTHFADVQRDWEAAVKAGRLDEARAIQQRGYVDFAKVVLVEWAEKLGLWWLIDFFK